jgi:hypothetical protein
VYSTLSVGVWCLVLNMVVGGRHFAFGVFVVFVVFGIRYLVFGVRYSVLDNTMYEAQDPRFAALSISVLESQPASPNAKPFRVGGPVSALDVGIGMYTRHAHSASIYRHWYIGIGI